MAELPIPQELSNDPGELARVYEEYIQFLAAQLAVLIHGMR